MGASGVQNVKLPSDYPSSQAAAPQLPASSGLLRVSIHRLSNGGTLERNAEAQRAFGPGEDSDTQDAFCAVFADLDEGRRVLALVGLGQVFHAETLLQTGEGPCWHEIEVRLLAQASAGLPAVQLTAIDISARRPSPAEADDPLDDPVRALEAAVLPPAQLRRA